MLTSTSELRERKSVRLSTAISTFYRKKICRFASVKKSMRWKNWFCWWWIGNKQEKQKDIVMMLRQKRWMYWMWMWMFAFEWFYIWKLVFFICSSSNRREKKNISLIHSFIHDESSGMIWFTFFRQLFSSSSNIGSTLLMNSQLLIAKT